MPLGTSFFEDVPLVEFICLVFTQTPGGVTVGDSGLCCCVPCLSSAIISLCLLIGGNGKQFFFLMTETVLQIGRGHRVKPLNEAIIML